MIAHMIKKQFESGLSQATVQQTLSVPRWVATSNGTVQWTGLWGQHKEKKGKTELYDKIN
jgi:hypothetical protein